ncbi:c-type cytochrome [Hyphococcus sp.]|uniref:c-type cytochrome n=1 Tax=Hyphococcus sp. TaxID=2038636 RepID=UPI003D1193F9
MRFFTEKLAATLLAAFAMAASSAQAAEAEGDPDLGRNLFQVWSCGACHILADAGGAGQIGPSLDGNPNISFDYLVSRISNGGGAMPPFAGQLTNEEIASLAAYILNVAE